MTKRSLLRGITLVLLLCLLLVPAGAYAQALSEPVDYSAISGRPADPETESSATILMEANTGAVLYSKNADITYYPASITKVMTALLTLEHCALSETVTFSYRATHELEEGSSSIARTDGEQLSVEECLYALLIASANEVAQALAEHVSGSIEEFVVLMNEKAKELGCKNTHFANPSGLNDPNHYTTCYDMALIMRAALQEPTFVKIDSTTSHYIPATNKNPSQLGIAMKHKLLQKGDDHYEYAQCGKTGYTSLAGYTLVTSALKDDMNLICVCMGDHNDGQARYRTTRTLFEFGFDNYSAMKISENDTDFQVSIEALDNSEFLSGGLVDIALDANGFVVVPDGVPFKSLERVINWTGEDPAVSYYLKDVRVGEAKILISGSEIDEFDFLKEDTYSPSEYATDEAEEEQPSGSSFFQSAVVRIVFIVIGILVLLLLIFVLVNSMNSRSRRLRRRRNAYRQKYRKR